MSNPGLDFETVNRYVLVMKVTDAGGFSTTSNLTINITDVNETPIFHNLPNDTSVAEDTTGIVSVFNVWASDPDGDSLMYVLSSSPPASFTISPSGLIETGTMPSFDYETTAMYTLHVNVSDGELSVVEDLVINVTDVNETPVVSDPEPQTMVLEIETESRLIYTVDASDEDFGDVLTYALESSIPAGPPPFSCEAASGSCH